MSQDQIVNWYLPAQSPAERRATMGVRPKLYRGWWYAVWTENGETRRVSLRTRDKAEALAAVALWRQRKGSVDRSVATPHTARHWLTRRYQAAHSRARRRKIEITLTREDMDTLFTQCGGRCSLTGIEFDLSRPTKGERQPFRMSLDRIDATKGYHLDNCRLVCAAVNFAMGHWGEGALYEIARGLLGDEATIQRLARLSHMARAA